MSEKELKQMSGDELIGIIKAQRFEIKEKDLLIQELRDTIDNQREEIEQLEEENEKLKYLVDDSNIMKAFIVEHNKTEQLENIRKEAIEYIKSYKNDYAPYELSDYNVREILNILNKGSDE